MAFKRTATSRAVALLLIGVTTAMAAPKPPITVIVTTGIVAARFKDAGSLERDKAVAAIERRLRAQKGVRLVHGSAPADITITVTSVGAESIWQPTPLADARPLDQNGPLPEGTRPGVVARATLKSADYQTAFAEAAGAFRSNAGENLARSIEAWFRLNESAGSRR